MAFLLPAERWAVDNKADSVLKEQPLYQATSQHRVSTQRSWMVKTSVSISTPDPSRKCHCQQITWYVTVWKMTLNQLNVLKTEEVNDCPSSGLLEPIQETGYLCCSFGSWASSLIRNELELDVLKSSLPISSISYLYHQLSKATPPPRVEISCITEQIKLTFKQKRSKQQLISSLLSRCKEYLVMSLFSEMFQS